MSWRASVVHRCDTVKRRCFFCFFFAYVCGAITVVCRWFAGVPDDRLCSSRDLSPVGLPNGIGI